MCVWKKEKYVYETMRYMYMGKRELCVWKGAYTRDE